MVNISWDISQGPIREIEVTVGVQKKAFNAQPRHSEVGQKLASSRSCSHTRLGGYWGSQSPDACLMGVGVTGKCSC